jgi:hypothetical protein
MRTGGACLTCHFRVLHVLAQAVRRTLRVDEHCCTHWMPFGSAPKGLSGLLRHSCAAVCLGTDHLRWLCSAMCKHEYRRASDAFSSLETVRTPPHPTPPGAHLGMSDRWYRRAFMAVSRCCRRAVTQCYQLPAIACAPSNRHHNRDRSSGVRVAAVLTFGKIDAR